MVLSTIFGLSAAAQTWSTTIEWNNPGSIKVLKGTTYSTATAVNIPAGATSVTLTEATGYFIVATEGYVIDSADLAGVPKAPTLLDYSSGDKGLKISAQYTADKNAYDGKTLKVVTSKLTFTPFTLNVANGASGLTFKYYKDNAEVSAISGVKDGVNNLQFPSNANQLFVQMGSFPRTALYSVKLNNVEQAEYNTLQHTYIIPLSANCNVYVAKEDPATAQNFEVTFKFTNNNPAIISNIFNITDADFLYPETFGAAGYKLTMPNNGKLRFNWNPEATITGLTANGTSVPVSGDRTEVTITGNTEFVVTGTMIQYAEKTVQIYLNDETCIDFSDNNEDLALTFVKDVPAGTVTLPSGYTIPIDTKLYEGKILAKPKAGVFFEPKSGYWVRRAARGTLAGAYAETEDIMIAGSSMIMLENMPLFIETGKITYSSPAWVYYQGPENAGKLQCKYTDGAPAPYQGQKDNLAQGWQQIMIDTLYNTNFTARISITTENQNWVKTIELDGVALGADENDNYNMPFSGTTSGNEDGKKGNNGVLGENSVLKMFFTPTGTPAYYTTLTMNGYAPAEITYDMCKKVDFTASTRLTNYGPTPFSIKPGANVIVKLDGVEQTPNAQGIIEFTVTKKNTITFEQNMANATLKGEISPKVGTSVRKLNKITYSIPFDGEHAAWADPAAASLVTLTKVATTRAADEPIHAISIEAGEVGETEIPLIITFPDVTEAGEYTLDIPAGVIYQTAWDDATESFAFMPGCKANEAITGTYTVDPTMAYTFSFTPADGTTNEFPTAGQIIVISADDAETLTAPATTTAGPWVKFNDVNVKKVDDADVETGWSFIETAQTVGKPAVAILVSQNVFTTVGKLEITADANAFTIDGKQESPAIAYSAQFGEKKVYNVVFTPEEGSTVAAIKPEIKFTFEGAKTVTVDETYFDAYFRAGLTQGIQIFPRMLTIDGNTVTFKAENDDAFPVGTYMLEILPGSFIIDGNQTNDLIDAKFVIERSTEYSQTWIPNPTTGVVNYGTGMGVAFVFGDDETVSRGTNFGDIKATFDGTELVPYSDNLDSSVMWYIVDFEPAMPNMLLVTAGGGRIAEATTSGALAVTVPAGAINISGTPLAEQAQHTWNLIAYHEYAIEANPVSGSTVPELKEIRIVFPDAQTVELSEFFNTGKISVKKGYAVVTNCSEVTPVEGAEHPTYLVKFATPLADAGNYTVNVAWGAFMLDGVFESDPVNFTYTVDPTLVGINGIYAEDGLYTVVNMQGVVIMSNASADKVNALPAGLYIINGQKVNIRK